MSSNSEVYSTPSNLTWRLKGSNDQKENSSLLATVFGGKYFWIYTLPETNIAPENGPSQKETSLPTIHFQGIC